MLIGRSHKEELKTERTPKSLWEVELNETYDGAELWDL